MILDLKPALLAALSTPEGGELLRQVLQEVQPTNDVPDELLTAEQAGPLLKMSPTAVRAAAKRKTTLCSPRPGGSLPPVGAFAPRIAAENERRMW